MNSIEQLLAQGLQYHQAGAWPQAELLYRQVLQADPDQPYALHLLGVLANRAGQYDLAITYMQKALARCPQEPVFHANLALPFLAQGKLDQIIACCNQALRLNPDLAEAHHSLGIALHRQKRWEEAVACHQHTLRLNPTYAQAHYDLGLVCRDRGKLEEAVGHFQQALRCQPDYTDAITNLGATLKAQGKLDAAADCYRRILQLQPNDAKTLSNLGAVFQEQGKVNEAVASYRQALALQPDLADAHNNLGSALLAQGKLDDAAACYQEAIRLGPDFALAHNNLGTVYEDQGKLSEALACYEQARRLDPEHHDARWNYGRMALLQSDFVRGWPEFDWRWEQPGLVPRTFRQPRWDGAPLAGKTILLYAEQGLGDTLQFVRYASLVRQRGGKVLVECQSSLLSLISRWPGVESVVAAGATLPSFDVQAPLMSLPGILGATLDTLPADVPYLSADPQRIDHWRSQLQAEPAYRVGIVWQGNPRLKKDRFRSVPLAQFTPLAEVIGVRLFSLQVGLGAEQLAASTAPRGMIDLGSRIDLQSFEDPAAILKVLDLVITVDTAIAHLGGALGVPVWVMLPFLPDWRWQLNQEDSPWYPTMRLFRQTQPGDWQGVFHQAGLALRLLLDLQ